MLHERSTLTDADIAALAELHGSTLNGSVLGELGPQTLCDYYRWVASSPTEHLFLPPGESVPAAAAVLSLDPSSVMRRFILSMPHRFSVHLARSALKSARLRRQMGAFARELLVDRPADSHLPEVLQIFAAPTQQSRGLGANLLDAVERYLRGIGISEYCVHTFKNGNDRALGFYRRCGFSVAGYSTFCGDEYVLLSKPTALPTLDVT